MNQKRKNTWRFSATGPSVAACGLLMLFFLGGCSSPPPPLPTENLTPPQESEAVREYLKRTSNREYPWYDEETESLQPVKFPEVREVKETEYKNPGEENEYSGFAKFLRTLVLWGLAVLGGILLAVLIYWGKVLWDRWHSADAKISADDTNEKRRTEALPEEIREQEGDFAVLARRAYEAGDYRLAIIYLFSLKLTKLDEHKRIHLLKGRTNRQYQKSLRNSLKKQFAEHYEAISINAAEEDREIWERYRERGKDLERIFADTMFLFEETFYGQRTPTKESVEACFLMLDDFLDILRELSVRVQRERTPWKVVAPRIPQNRPGERMRNFPCWFLFFIIGIPMLTGCGGEKTLNVNYGRQQSYQGYDSIQGTKVFADMLTAGGSRISTEGYFMRERDLEKANCVVWFILGFENIDAETYLHMEKWLKAGTPEKPRTLLTVFRAFDGEDVYYDRVFPKTDEKQKKWIAYRRKDLLQGENLTLDRNRWVYQKRFLLVRQNPVTELQGDAFWTDGVDVSKADIWTTGRMRLDDGSAWDPKYPGFLWKEVKKFLKDFSKKAFRGKSSPGVEDENEEEYFAEPWDENVTVRDLRRKRMLEEAREKDCGCESEDKPKIKKMSAEEREKNCRCLLSDQDGKPLLVSRDYKTEDGAVTGTWLAAANGSFLLNAQLVNPENRKLAYRLAVTLAAENRRTIFLEAGSGVFILSDQDGGGRRSEDSGWEMFKVFPLNFILLHLTAMMIFYMFYKYPIFGRPRRLFVSGGSRFSEHVRAVGRMLRRR